MSNALTEARSALADLIDESGIRVVPEVPQTFSPPLCWVLPRAPYRYPGQTFGRKSVNLAVMCMAAQGTNAVALEAVENMSSQVADLIDASGSFRLDPEEEIGAPTLYTSAQGQDYLVTSVNVIAEVERA